MDKKIIKFGKTENKKRKCHKYKNSISVYHIDINKILASSKVSFGKNGFKFFIGYKNGKEPRPLRVILPKLSTYRRDFDETKYMSFLIKK